MDNDLISEYGKYSKLNNLTDIVKLEKGTIGVKSYKHNDEVRQL